MRGITPKWPNISGWWIIVMCPDNWSSLYLYHILPHHNKICLWPPPTHRFLLVFSTKPRWGNSKWPTHKMIVNFLFPWLYIAKNCLCVDVTDFFSNLKLVGGAGNMNLMTFHSVGNFIIPTELTNSYFSEGWPNHQPVLLALKQLSILFYNPIIFHRGRPTTNQKVLNHH